MIRMIVQNEPKKSPSRHILVRHEQHAVNMVDAYGVVAETLKCEASNVIHTPIAPGGIRPMVVLRRGLA